MRIRQTSSGFEEYNEPYTLKDLARDIPDMARKARAMIPHAKNAQFGVQGDTRRLLAWVTEGSNAQWYRFDPLSEFWVKYTF